MISLVGYSGSDSDSADEDVANKKSQSTHAPAEAHHTSRPDVNKPLQMSFTGPGPGTTVIINDDIMTSSTVQAVSNQVNDAKDESDFFGLENESSDDDEEEYFAKGNNIWSKPISLPKRVTKGTPPSTTTNRNDRNAPTCFDGGNTNTNEMLAIAKSTIVSGTQTIDLPKSQFWTGNSKSQNWHNPGQIWGDAHNSSGPRELESKGYIPQNKKPKLERSQESSPHEQFKSGPLSKSCFFVHHKILPHLHQQRQNKPPTRRYICLEGHAGAVNRVKWAKADYSHLLVSASMDRTVRIWNTFSSVSHCIQTFCSHTKAVKDVTWSPSGKEVLSCGYDRTARLYDVVKGVEIGTFEHRDFLTCIKYHPVNPNYILAGSKDRVLCWDIRSPESCIKTFSYKHSFGQVQDLVFTQDGREFFISTDMVTQDSADRTIMVYDFGSGVVLSNQVYQERYVCPRLGLHPHQSEVMAQSGGNYMCLFSTIRPYKMNRCKRFEGHKVLGYSIGCDYSPDGRLVVSGSADSKVTVWDYQKAVPLKQLGDANQIYLDVAWHPVLSSTVASSSWSGDIDIWQ